MIAYTVPMTMESDADVMYHFGYQGRQPADVLPTLAACGVKTLCDIRYRAGSRNRLWGKTALTAACRAAGIEYAHINDLGNVLFKSHDIRLSNPERGIASLMALDMPVAIMCVCASADGCHRSTVMRLVDAVGHAVEFRAV